MRIAIYVRVSTLDQAREGYSLAAQRKTLEAWIKDNGHKLVAVYEDAGISAKDIDHRPAMRQLLDDAKKRDFDVVLFWALSRFTRSIPDLYHSIDHLEKYGITIKSYTEPFDTCSVFGRFVVGLLGLIAVLEREITAERVKASMMERAAQGKRTCNEVLGYDLNGPDGLRINEAEAERVRYIYDRYLEYRNLSAVAELCTLKGYCGKRGRVFKAQHIKTILTRPVYAGYNTYCGDIYKGTHDPIISEAIYNRVQRALGEKCLRSKNKKAGTTRF